MNDKRKKYIQEWQTRKRDRIAKKPDKNKVQCLVCGLWYVQVGSHVVQRHRYKSARAYREHFKLEVKKGTVPAWYRKMKGELALKNKTYLNLKAGKKYQFKKGEKGVGLYKRSPITLARLNKLYKFRKRSK
jgi:hypothetical protein